MAEAQPTISTHVLDLATGLPAADVGVTLFRLDAQGRPELVADLRTDADGRIRDLLDGDALTAGDYQLAFDVGGHRFFSKSRAVEDLWTEILPDDLLVRRRSSRIYYRGRFFSYPLKLGETLVKLSPYEASACLPSYLRARLEPARPRETFEDWVSARFGVCLYQAFFKT